MGQSRAGAGILSETIEAGRSGPREPLIRPERYGFFDELLFAVFVLAVPPFIASNWSVFRDGDVSWHIAAGRWIIEHRAVPVTDPFSFTMPGTAWVAHEWGAEVIQAIAYDLAGPVATRCLRSLVGSSHQCAAFVVSGSMVVRGDRDVDPLSLTFSATC